MLIRNKKLFRVKSPDFTSAESEHHHQEHSINHCERNIHMHETLLARDVRGIVKFLCQCVSSIAFSESAILVSINPPTALAWHGLLTLHEISIPSSNNSKYGSTLLRHVKTYGLGI
jgi:hypothetical protein